MPCQNGQLPLVGKPADIRGHAQPLAEFADVDIKRGSSRLADMRLMPASYLCSC